MTMVCICMSGCSSAICEINACANHVFSGHVVSNEFKLYTYVGS